MCFTDIVEAICRGCSLCCASWEPGRKGGEYEGYVRARLDIRTDQRALDAFHNGFHGLRAQYWRSRSAGDHARLQLLQRVLQLHAKLGGNFRGEIAVPAQLLADETAKAWIRECSSWMSNDEIKHLCVEKWENNLVVIGPRESCLGFATWPFLMPVVSILEVKGAWQMDGHWHPKKADDWERIVQDWILYGYS